MRIISGTARGRKLKAPEGMSTRPTEDRIKENVFNLLQGPFWDARVLDLFAGSGGIGIEFISRGAGLVWFNDKAPSCKKIIEENLDLLSFRESSRVFSNDFMKVLSLAKKESMQFDFIYLDPPYENHKMYFDCLSFIDENHLLADMGSVIVEGPENMVIPDFPGMLLRKFKKYRSTGIWIFDKREDT